MTEKKKSVEPTEITTCDCPDCQTGNNIMSAAYDYNPKKYNPANKLTEAEKNVYIQSSTPKK